MYISRNSATGSHVVHLKKNLNGKFKKGEQKMTEPMKYRKKPVVIEAMQWDGSASSAGDIIDWVLERPETRETPSYWEANETGHREHAELHINTLGGVMIASPGDWIIIGVQNEVYPCKPDIFEATYEAVSDV